MGGGSCKSLVQATLGKRLPEISGSLLAVTGLMLAVDTVIVASTEGGAVLGFGG